MTGWHFLYLAGVFMSWGFFMSIPNKTPVTNALMACIWPIAWLMILGYALGQKAE